MTPPTIGRLLESATEDLRSDLDPHEAWTDGVRRRRRSAGRLVVAATAAAVAVVAAVMVGVTDQRSSTPDPLPSPTPSDPGRTDEPGVSPYAVQEHHVLPTYDPATWDQLPEFPTDLGWWAQADRLVPLEESPVERATAVVQVMLGPEDGHLWIFGDDSRWRSLDDVGFDLVDNGEWSFGIGPRSLSPEGTRLAIHQEDAIVVVDLTSAEQRTYPVTGLGEPWTWGAPTWSPDGRSVLLSQYYDATGDEGDWAFRHGWRLDLEDGAVSRVPYDPAHTALFADGSFIVNEWSDRIGHQWWVDRDGERTRIDLDPSAVYQQGLVAQGDRWAAVRELTYLPEGDLAWEASGIVVRDAVGAPVALLPVVGTENHGGGGRVLGWVDDSTMLFAMPWKSSTPGGDVNAGVVAWNVDTGELFRGPLLLSNETVTVAAR
jgi:hypothetical protein